MERNLPAEIILIVGNYLRFKEYIQLSQTCKTIERILTSTSAIDYLNHRFKFGHDTGALLLFTYYNILHVPKLLRKVVLDHFIYTTKDDIAFLVKGWSIIHAIGCSDPGKFMTTLLTDEENDEKLLPPKQQYTMIMDTENKEELILKHQQLFSIEIFDRIIDSHTRCKTKICKTKTYQSVFKKLVLLGDLRTVEHCLRSLGPPTDSTIIFDLDYSNRFPLNNQQPLLTTTTQHNHRSLKDAEYASLYAEVICKHSLYYNYTSDEMCSLTENLFKKYNIKVKRESKSRNPNRCFMNTT